MNKLCALIIAPLLFVLVWDTPAVAQSTTMTGYVRNYTGILLEGDQEYAILQDTFDLRIEHTRGKVAFKANPYIYFYHNREKEIDLRQSYMDIRLETVDIRIGKQQIVWGKADGVFITDVISPKDLSEYLLPDFEEIRIGVQALKVDYYIGNNSLEFVWVPDFTPTRIPAEDSIWYVRPPFPGTATFDYSKKEVPSKFSNSELFLKYSAMTSLIDVELMAGSMWDDNPTLHVTQSISPSTGLPVLTVTPEHHRLELAGGSFSAALGGMVFRGEGAYYRGKYFNSEDPALNDRVVKKDYAHFLLGLDFTLLDIKMSLQVIEKQIQDYDESIINEEREDTVTFLMSRDFLRETLKLELFSYIGMNDNGSLIRPKMTYDLMDGFQIVAGFNIFTGNKGTYGQFDDKDMIYSKIKYAF
ncbi:hypothetical protein KKI24_21420 [bacterium]|nr:hypothetical protein [bacterium]